MLFLANTGASNNHLTALRNSLKTNNHAYFAVAFLKSSGLEELIKPIKDFLNKGGELQIVVGQNFGLTEPAALYRLHALFKHHPNSRLFLAKAESKTDIFHPKLYLFRHKQSCSIISGSANITKGGLVTNKEASLLLKCNATDKIWIDTKSYFDLLTNPKNADEAFLLVIGQYETYYENQKRHNRNVKPVPQRTVAQLAFSYNNLLGHFQKFDNDERNGIFEAKMDNYRKARKVLNEIADHPRLTQSHFESLLDKLVGKQGQAGLWHSGSLLRLRKYVYNHHAEFKQLVRYVRDNKNSPANVVYTTAKAMVDEIEGAAANYVAEMMMTYNWNKYANINRNPITVLKEEGGVKLKAHSSSFSGDDYQKYCDLVQEICDKLKLRNMLEADSFFNKIYWEIYKRSKK